MYRIIFVKVNGTHASRVGLISQTAKQFDSPRSSTDFVLSSTICERRRL